MQTRPTVNAAVRSALGAAALYAGLCVAAFWPQSLHPQHQIAYVGDSLESVYLVAWNVHQFFSDPLRLFESNVFFPLPHALALTDHRLRPSLLVAPVLWLTGNAVLAYNVALGIAYVFAASAARRLALVLGCGAAGAWACGALYAFHTYQVNEAPRLNIVFHGFLPLALAALIGFLRDGRTRQAWAVATLMLLQGLSSNYHLLYGVLLIAIVMVGTAAFRPALLLRRLPGLLLPMVTAAALFSPVVSVYLASALEISYEREVDRGIDLQHYVTTTPTNLVYGAMGAPFRQQQRGPHFVGFVALGLAIFALSLHRRDHEPTPSVPARVWVPAAAALALLFVALSLGRDITVWGWNLGPGPYRLLYEFVPGFRQVRIPERLSLLAMLFVGLLVARTLSLLARRGRAGRLSAFALAALVSLEHLSPQVAQQAIPVGSEVPRVYSELQRLQVGALAELPLHGELLIRKETLEMYFSTFHWKPIVHGYASYQPPATERLRRLLAELPGRRDVIPELAAAGVGTLVVHLPSEELLLAYRRARQKEKFRFAHDLPPIAFYVGWGRLKKSAALKEVARFSGLGVATRRPGRHRLSD